MHKIKLLLLAFFSLFLVMSAPAYAAPVNVNTASIDEIADSLNGVGPAKAEAISTHCKKVKCQSPEDLLEVKGIGEKTLMKISEDLRF